MKKERGRFHINIFGFSVNLYRCLVQTRFSVLTFTTEDASRNPRVVCQGFINFWTDNFSSFRSKGEVFLLTTEGHIEVRHVLRYESRMHFALNFRSHFLFSDFQVVTCLQVQPKLWCCAKVTSKP